ncbi:hypothetical protein Lal_00047130 [Lupinus albus]|nr:hypothetical protein Lal_00047130 [Lupinus albus]
MNFCISHIYREGNSCADKLASYGIVSMRKSIWFSPPNFLTNEYHRNRLGLPNFRFCNLFRASFLPKRLRSTEREFLDKLAYFGVFNRRLSRNWLDFPIYRFGLL